MLHINTAEEFLSALSTTQQDVQSEENGDAFNSRFARWRAQLREGRPSAFKHIEASDLIIWRASIPIDEDADDEIIMAINIDSKKLLMATCSLSKAFKDGIPEDTIHIIVRRPKDFTLEDVNNLYGISNLDIPEIPDLPAFEGISSEAFDSDLHKGSLRKPLDDIDSRIRAITSHTTNEATCSAHVYSFLTQAVLIFKEALTLAPERALRGRHGHGKVDYSIEASTA
ncbi:hypothetical protein BGZ46_004019 [Entomortierella lignicola]|nr:hypothetical protein BGZ46_004019 [Entomortierella lignicola]